MAMSTPPTRLKTALQTLGHTSAIKAETVRMPGFELEFEEVPAIIQAFRRMVRRDHHAMVIGNMGDA